MLAGHFIPSLQHVIKAELSRIDVRLAVDEEPLLDVVVVSPFSRVIWRSIHEVLRLFGQTRILATNPARLAFETSRTNTSLGDNATMSA